MPDNITFDIQYVGRRRNQTVVELEGLAASLMPDFVVETRARLKAIRVVGGEQVARGALDEVSEGNLGRVTEIIDFDIGDREPPGGREVFITVAVDTGD